jgi:pRiA4b ORF-3-like protein
MPAKKAVEVPSEIYQIKVTLMGTKPPIWRRLLVPADLTLAQLHGVLQAAMEWDDSHLHEFRIGGEQFGMPDPMVSFGGPRVRSDRGVQLFEVLGHKGAKAVYAYDFGDGWEHSVIVEKVLARDPETIVPVCIGGKQHAPPEDCGGVPGFYNLLDAIRDPEHEQHQELREWFGGDLDPEEFSVEEINERLAKFQRAASKRLKASQQ